MLRYSLICSFDPIFPGTRNYLKWPLTPDLCQPRQHWPIGFHMCIWYQCAVLHVADMNFWRYLDSDLIFDPCDPKWPQMKKWSNYICRVGQGDEHTWVTGPCCIILRTWCVFGKKWPFWPCDLGWPLTRSMVLWHVRARSLIFVTKFHWNRSKQLEGTLGYMIDRRRRRIRKNH